MYKLICMSFDGNFVTERDEFDSVAEAWECSENLGSKWYFYPFHFVVSASKKTVIDAGQWLEHFNGKRLDTVRSRFAELAALPEMQDADCEIFALSL